MLIDVSFFVGILQYLHSGDSPDDVSFFIDSANANPTNLESDDTGSLVGSSIGATVSGF